MHRCFTFPQLSNSDHSLPDPPTPPGHLTATSPRSLSSLEYSRAIQTDSYKELWQKIHPSNQSPTAGCESNGQKELEDVLRPDPASVAVALSSAPSSRLTSLAVDYFHKSELACRLSLSLQRAVNDARRLYSGLHRLLDVIPDSPRLSDSDCSVVFNELLAFHRDSNPFRTSLASEFDEIRSFFSGLRREIDRLLRRARGKGLLLRRAKWGSAAVLVGLTAAVVVVGVVIATHGVAAIATAVPMAMGGSGNLLEGRRRKAKEEERRLKETMEGTYVGDYVDTMRCVAEMVEAKVESDRTVAGMGVRRGTVERHAIEEVLGLLRKGRGELTGKLEELEQHVCICCAAVNRSRLQLLRQIQQQGDHQQQQSQTQSWRRRMRISGRKSVSG